MQDSDFESRSRRHIKVQRIADRIQTVRAMTPEERDAWRADCAKKVREANCEFCKRFPEQCK